MGMKLPLLPPFEGDPLGSDGCAGRKGSLRAACGPLNATAAARGAALGLGASQGQWDAPERSPGR